MDDEDLFIENILNEKKQKKKIDGKMKGNRTELSLCKLFTEHFGVEFTRSVGSGNRWGQVNLSETAKQVFSGDICVPDGFLWVIECKGGYESDIDLTNALEGPIPRLQEFFDQCVKDSGYCLRKPLVCWKRNRKNWIAFIRRTDLWEGVNLLEDFLLLPHHKEWCGILLDSILKKTDRSFWFKENNA